MQKEKFELMLPDKNRLTMAELGRRAGLSREAVYRYFIFGLIDQDVDHPEPLFTEEALVRIHKIERLRSDLGVNLAGCGLVLDLLARIEELEDQLCLMREQLST
jgi:DNA-binding transcriptional MerR regulator